MRVLVFPKDKNPYQELLYSEVRKKGVEVKYLKLITKSHTLGMLFLPLQLFYYRLCGYSVFHLHWLYDFSTPTSTPVLKVFTRLFYTVYLVKQIILLKVLGYKLVWTVHNLLPHENQFINDEFITKFVANMSYVCIAHTLKAKADLEKLSVKPKTIKVISHGSYIGYYENNMTRREARALLEIQDTDFVFLFIGQLREYKGVLELLEHFKKITTNNDSIKLIVAGSCLDDYISQSIVRYKKDLGDSLITNLANIPDEDIQMYMNASDVVVFPFRKVTTSGSMLLAMSFGKPVIYPEAFFKELPNDIGFKYKNINDLYRTMKNASVVTDLKEKGVNAKNYAAQFTWTDIAEKTYELYKSIS
jgi:glycosyltransferase involved in cell wall biosynthesis